MGTFFRRCLTLLIVVVVGCIVGVGLAVACDSDDSVSTNPPITTSPIPTPLPTVNAADLFHDYQRNETRVNELYKRRWLTVTLTSIDEIDAGGIVRRQMISGMESGQIELDFKNDRDVIWLNPGDTVTAECKLRGKETQWLTAGFVVRFHDCRTAQEGEVAMP